jgi:undecaprenyl-diphosphatase
MTFFDALLLGIVEGVSEFLPISSTGHLILASNLLQIPGSEFLKTFEISIQFGAIASVVVLYARRFLEKALLVRLLAGLIPTGIIGFLAYPLLKENLLENEMIVLAALFVGGIALIVFELTHREPEDSQSDLSTLPLKTAFFVGLFQALAVIPGVSRSAATIVGGLLLGMRRVAIVEFSFLLAVPTILAASLYDLSRSASSFQSGDLALLAIGFVTSFVVALGSIKFLLAFVQKHTFIPFGVYRIVISILFFAFIVW